MSESPSSMPNSQGKGTDSDVPMTEISFASTLFDHSRSTTPMSTVLLSRESLISQLKGSVKKSPVGSFTEDVSDLFGVRGFGPPKKSRGRPPTLRKKFNVTLETNWLSEDEDSVISHGDARTARSGRPVRKVNVFSIESAEATKRRGRRRKSEKKEDTQQKVNRKEKKKVSSSVSDDSDESSSDNEAVRDVNVLENELRGSKWAPYNRVADPKKIQYQKRLKEKQKKKYEQKQKEKMRKRLERTRREDANEGLSSDSDSRPGFMYIDMDETRLLGPRKKVVAERKQKIINMDPFSSPKKQRVGVLQLEDLDKSPSKRGVLPMTSLSPSRTPNGRAGSPRKVKERLLIEKQDRSARKKLNKKLYRALEDGLEDADDELLEEDARLAEKIIRESREEPETPTKPKNTSSYNTPKKNAYDLPTHNPDFVATPLPTAREDEDFLEFKFDDKALFLDGPDGYFDQHRQKIRASHNSMVQAPSLEYDEFNSLILLSGFMHHPQKEVLLNGYKEMYTQWLFELEQGFSLLFYGIGSKRAFMLSFLQEFVVDNVDCPSLVINGYNPLTSFLEILRQIVAVFKIKNAPKRTGELVEFLVKRFEEMKDKSPKLVILFHNIDAEPLRDEKTQDYLSKLVSIKQFYLISSVDHVNAPLLWDSIRLSNFNFVWHNITTFTDYLTELSFIDPLVLGQTQKSAGSKGAKYVLSSLTNNSKSLYRVLASHQLQNMEDELTAKDNDQRDSMRGSIKTAIEFSRLFHLCAEEFISSNEINFRTMLTEFIEHRMAVITKDPSGTEMVFIPFSLEELQKLLEEELL